MSSTIPNRLRRIAWLALLIFSLAPTPVMSQAGEPGPGRSLNGHSFIPSGFVGDPFISTFVRTLSGAGIATDVIREIEDPALDPITGLLEDNLTFLSVEFEYQHAVTDWLALNATAMGSARIGTERRSALAHGVTSYFGLKLGAAARFYRSERWTFSGVARFQPTIQYRLDALTFVRRVIEEGLLAEGNSLVLKADGVGAALGLRGAYAPRDYLGFIFGGEVGYADNFDSAGGDETATEFSLLASFDMNPLKGIPLGLIASAMFDDFVVENSDITEHVTTFGWGVSYTGRDEFSPGVEITHKWLPLTDADRTATATLIAFNLKYFF